MIDATLLTTALPFSISTWLGIGMIGHCCAMEGRYKKMSKMSNFDFI
ncbi:hypothetical protein [Pedobacter sp. UYP1]